MVAVSPAQRRRAFITLRPLEEPIAEIPLISSLSSLQIPSERRRRQLLFLYRGEKSSLPLACARDKRVALLSVSEARSSLQIERRFQLGCLLPALLQRTPEGRGEPADVSSHLQTIQPHKMPLQTFACRPIIRHWALPTPTFKITCRFDPDVPVCPRCFGSIS